LAVAAAFAAAAFLLGYRFGHPFARVTALPAAVAGVFATAGLICRAYRDTKR
jgi:hypothetical protein